MHGLFPLENFENSFDCCVNWNRAASNSFLNTLVSKTFFNQYFLSKDKKDFVERGVREKKLQLEEFEICER